MDYGCKGLCALISGGTSGIGLAVAEKLLLDGARVYILGRSLARGLAAVALLEAKTGQSPAFVPCDVSRAESCRETVEQIKAELKEKGASASSSSVDKTAHIDILVNCAGVYREQRLEELTAKDYEQIFDVNVKGTLFLTQAVLPLMLKGGSIINISSDAGISGNYGCPVYCASKGAIVALTKALALDLAPQIRVNCVCPADVDTPLLQEQLAAAQGSYTLEEMASAYPLERIGKAEEVAHVICALASPQNSFMTGSIVPVDGGITAKG